MCLLRMCDGGVLYAVLPFGSLSPLTVAHSQQMHDTKVRGFAVSNDIWVHTRNRRIFHYRHPEHPQGLACSPTANIHEWRDITESEALNSDRRPCKLCLLSLEAMAHVV